MCIIHRSRPYTPYSPSTFLHVLLCMYFQNIENCFDHFFLPVYARTYINGIRQAWTCVIEYHWNLLSMHINSLEFTLSTDSVGSILVKLC